MNNAKLWLAGKPIKTDDEYQEVLGMVEKLERYIADRWFEDDPQIKRWVAAHELLAQSLLMFDIDNDKLPI
jgi:hypothetical protein